MNLNDIILAIEKNKISLIVALVYIIFAPIIGGLLAGIDRIITARMQNRVGPPLLQPFYDVFKLFSKKTMWINRFQGPFVFCHLIFMICTGALFFEGRDILLIIFMLSVASIFFILAAYCTSSPFSIIGAERELLLIMAYEPMILIMLVGFYKVVGSFKFYEIILSGKHLILYLPGVFLGFLYVLTIKFRKSPFDLSYSHHAHQEITKGITTDLSAKSLAVIEISHWYENVFLFGLIFIFFSSFNWILAIIITLFVYFFEILIDNTYARVKWEWVLKSSWAVALIAGGGNIILLYLLNIK
ncbi:MAG: Ech hydrogenase subunit EchB [Spirochaetes bacterium GWD1_27_9]|nr:MAG: Ech hydrogenase subunit EchB [Spirochaetes bacterium GWB1_27_13]OHD27541.1 MAG: Ech hydrogenase subunit EchB [Spirochaetes bacterium GWC1_27_15]OHD44736.1 MAG: Ech hydrogenase subunit EchB [Spirochaetes bacterium GWD1_27_9]